MLKLKTNLKQINNKRTLVNLYKDMVLVTQIHAIQIYLNLWSPIVTFLSKATSKNKN